MGQGVYMIGNIEKLGRWNTDNAIKLDATNYPDWTGTIALPADTYIEWKCIKIHNTDIEWQSGSNNTFTTPVNGTLTASDYF